MGKADKNVVMTRALQLRYNELTKGSLFCTQYSEMMNFCLHFVRCLDR